MGNRILGKRFFFIFILFFFVFSLHGVSGQDKKAANEEYIQKLRKEIISVYKTGGKQALLDFFRKNRNKITNKFILDFAKVGVKERKEEWLNICEIMAEESKDEKTLADVLYQTGKYFGLIPNSRKASRYLDKALLIYQKLKDRIGQGNVFLGRGNIYLDSGKHSNVLEMYDKALYFYEKSGSSLRMGKVFSNKGDFYLDFGEYSKALEMYNKALHSYEKVSGYRDMGDVYYNKGNIYFFTGNNNKAHEMYDKALVCYKKGEHFLDEGYVYLRKGMAYSHTGERLKGIEMYDNALPLFEKAGDLIGQGNVYVSKGDFYFYTGDIEKASDMYNKAFLFFKKPGNIQGLGNVYKKKGDVYSHTGKNDKALMQYNIALPLFEKIGDFFGQADVFRSKGEIYFQTGEYSKAHEMYDKALAISEKVGEPRGQGVVYLGKGDIYFYSGKYSKAFEFYNKALHFFEKAAQSLGQGNVYYNKGDIYLRIGDFLKALEFYNKAMRFYKKEGTIYCQANVYLRQGTIYFNTGNNAKAIEMYDKALCIYDRVGNPLDQGNVCSAIGDIYSRSGKYSRALEMYDKSLVFFKKIGYPICLGNSYHNVGEVYSKIGNYSKALSLYEKALEQYAKIEEIEAASFSLYEKAQIMIKQGKRDKGLSFYEKAILKLEKVRFQSVFPELNINFIREIYNKYEEVTLLMIENKYHYKAFKYAATMKARVFLDRMGEGLVPLEKGLKPELKEQREKLLAKLSNLSKKMQETGGKEEQKLAELKEQYKKVENEFEELLIKIRLDNPLYASVRYPEPVSLKELRKKVLKKGEILLRYFISPDATYVFLISKKSFKVVPIKIKADKIKSHVNLYLEAVENKTGDVKFYGEILYQELFKPIEGKLEKDHDVIIVPDAHLEKIPFEALISGENESGKPVYLIEKYRLKYIQSASVLSILRKHYQRERETYSFIGFGDPVYDYESFKVGKPEKGSTARSSKEENEIKDVIRTRYAQSGGILDRLPGSGEEVRSIGKLFENKEQKAVLYSREQATEEKAKSANLKEFDFIHFACHGLLNDDFQSLVLSQDIPGAKEDGYFTLNEIMNCDYNAKLVVLSACQTGAGKMEKGEGVTGLTRAVMYAGTPAVVASLWKVDDNAAQELMVRFYKNLLENNMSKTEALRQAKLDLIKSNAYSSPVSWSAFVLYGE
jgi:CHAT domain-containing protein/Tfp pilus assembly protein PilF